VLTTYSGLLRGFDDPVFSLPLVIFLGPSTNLQDINERVRKRIVLTVPYRKEGRWEPGKE
jgi:hypothetical protein